jgi:hypothetical protein
MADGARQATRYADVGLVGLGVFVALALVMATLGAPSTSEVPPTT